MPRIFGYLIASVLFLCASAVGVFAQTDYPTRPIRIVIPYGGGSGDALARLVADKLETALGQPIVVEQRPGAATVLGIEYVANAPADGYTLLLAFSSITVNPITLPNVNYDAAKDFVPIGRIATVPHLLVVNPAIGVKNVQEFIDLAKAKPGALNYGSSAIGGSTHLEMVILNKLTGTDMTHIPYQSGAAVVVDLLGQRLQASICPVASCLQHVQSGALVALAITGDERIAALPDVPIFSEVGVEGYTAVEWAGLFAPHGTDPAIVEKLSTTLTTAIQDEKFQKEMLAVGFEPSTITLAEFKDLLANDPWTDIAKELGIKVEP